MTNTNAQGWVAVARETFEHNMRPWMGRRYEGWLRGSVRPHAMDPQGQVLVPRRIYDILKKRRIFAGVTATELAAACYPKLPRDLVPQPALSIVEAHPIQQAVPSPPPAMRNARASVGGSASTSDATTGRRRQRDRWRWGGAAGC
jgi:hypothetical protein